jgi:hypothetical protein
VRVRWLLVALLIIPPAACATAGAGRASPPIDATIQRRIAESGGVAWNGGRPLTWADFRGAAPAEGVEGAQTHYNLLFGLGCVGSAVHFEVAALFLPDESWVKPTVLVDPLERLRTLRHEQTHFDVTEVFARRLRRFFATAYDPCGRRLEETQAGAERYVGGETDTQRRYDDETRHGLDASHQALWDRDVSGWLDELAAYRASDDTR